jgi:hypothetical protein
MNTTILTAKDLVTKIDKEKKENPYVSPSELAKLKREKLLTSFHKHQDTWTEEKQIKNKEIRERLVQAHENVVDYLKCKFQDIAIGNVRRNNFEFNVFGWDRIKDVELNGFSINTILFGFWDSNKKRHNRLTHYDAGLTLLPFNQMSKDLKDFGYIITDVSDPTISINKVAHVKLITK